MFCFITDSTYIYNKNKDFLFKTDLFKWTIHPKQNTLGLDKLPIDKKIMDRLNFEEIIGVISPSNYRMLFDLKEVNYKKIYFPESYEKGKPAIINMGHIDILFEKFLKRSYISFLNYEKLQNLGLNRIEQYIILLNTLLFKKFKSFDNLLVSDRFKIISFEKVSTISYKNNRIDLFKFLRLLCFKYDLSFDEASKYIIYLYSKLIISDPFMEEGFVLMKKIEDEEFKALNNILINILKKEIFVDVYKLTVEDNKGIKKEYTVNKLIEFNEDYNSYFGCQKEDYYTDTYIYPEENNNNIDFILSNLIGILPIRDILLTLKSLIKLGKIKNNKMFFFIEEKYGNSLRLKHNIEWVTKNAWEKIYLDHSYSFNNILDEISSENLSFICPCCGANSFRFSPMKFFCVSYSCGFSFDRISLKEFNFKPILENKMLESLIHKKVFLRNKFGRNYIVYLKNRGKYHFLSLKN